MCSSDLTLTYAVPAGPLADRMSSAEVGIVFHTTYEGGPTLDDMSARFGADVRNLGSSPHVWYRDAGIKDVSGSVTLTKQETYDLYHAIKELRSYLKGIGQQTFTWLDGNIAGQGVRDLIKIDINKMVRAGAMDQPGGYVQRFIDRLKERLEADIAKLKTEKGQERKRAAQEEALNFIKRDPLRYIKLYIAKLFSFIFLDLNSSYPNYYNFLHTVPKILISISSLMGIFFLINKKSMIKFSTTVRSSCRWRRWCTTLCA